MDETDRDVIERDEAGARDRRVEEPAREKTRPDGGREPRGRKAAVNDAGRGKDAGEHGHREQEQDRKSHGEGDESEPWSRTKKLVVWGVLGAVLLVGVVVAVLWWLHARQFETTDDAFIDAHAQRLAPQVAGRVRRVLVVDNQPVNDGDVLVEIDPSDYQVQVEQAQAAVAGAKGKVSQAQAQCQVAEAMVEQAGADLEQAKVSEANAKAQLGRYEGLSQEARSQQQLEDLRAAAKNAEAQRVAVEKKLVAARAQVDLAQSQERAANADVAAAQAKVEQARLNLSYASVRAAIPGRVTNLQVQAGDYLAVGQQLMVLVPDEVWVTANYKETQLARMRVGQEVQIKVDAYPDAEFRGRVDSIQKGSGAWFSLLPPENATGNYVKVVQRVPVKIVFEDRTSDAYRRLARGMSASPKVRVR